MDKPKVLFHQFKISVPEKHGFRIIRYADILWLQANGQYTQLALLACKSACYIYEPLTQLERALPPVFFRCHRSVIVNICHVQSFNHEGILVDNHILPVTKKKITEIIRLLEKNKLLTFPLCHNCDNCPEFTTCTIIRPFTARKFL